MMIPMVFTIIIIIEGSDKHKDLAEKWEKYFENMDSDTNLLMLLKYLQERNFLKFS